ncbi:MAG: ferrochelatase [Thermodesulfobacteriota bacterium]
MIEVNTEPSIAVLLLAFGGPDSLKEVEPFLNNVLKTSGRNPTQAQLQKVIEKYRLIGGRSPLLDITLEQAGALEKQLKEKGGKVYVGMRQWSPFINETLKAIKEDGIDQIVAVIMAPHSSKASTGAYIKEVDKALSGFDSGTEVSFVDSWHDHPLFLDALTEKIEEGFNLFPGVQREDIHVIFSAHSLPLRVLKGDAYLEQLNATIQGLLKIIGPVKWQLAFQSKGGGPGEWLGPDVDTALKQAADIGEKKVLLVPIGFVSDHLETLYDIDVLYKKKAEEMGISFRRSPSLNASPKFISALAGIICEHLGVLRRNFSTVY